MASDLLCQHCDEPIEPAEEPTLGYAWQHKRTTAIRCHWTSGDNYGMPTTIGPTHWRPVGYTLAEPAGNDEG